MGSSSILATLKDIQPNRPKPTLELSFSALDASRLPQGADAHIAIEIEGAVWKGTIFNNGKRRAYVHTRLKNEHGKPLSCTEVFEAIGMAHDAALEFEITNDRILRLARIVRHGAWPPGRRTSR